MKTDPFQNTAVSLKAGEGATGQITVTDGPVFSRQQIERLAKIIDPESFGLPDNQEPNTITDRDAARDRARLILRELAQLILDQLPATAPDNPYPPDDKISIEGTTGNGAITTITINGYDQFGNPMAETVEVEPIDLPPSPDLP